VRIIGFTLISRGFSVDYIKFTALRCLTNNVENAKEFIRLCALSDRNAVYEPTRTTNMIAFLHVIVADLAGGAPSTGRAGFAAWDYNAGQQVDQGATLKDKESGFSMTVCQMRTLATSEKGCIALVFSDAREGDVIFTLQGRSMLYALRPPGNEYLFHWRVLRSWIYGR
jgi:hypothetical protein